MAEALLPDRHPTGDFFVCDIFGGLPKDDLASMEHPIFSLSTKPDRRQRRYELHDRFVEITPSVLGLATIHDRDILIYCISQLIAAANDGREVSSTVRFKAYDLLIATNRMTNGQGYEALKADTATELRSMLEFVGESPDDERIAKAVELSDFERMRSIERREKSRGAGSLFRGGKESLARDAMFMNKGEVGQSLAPIDEALDAEFDEAFDADLGRFGYGS